MTKLIAGVGTAVLVAQATAVPAGADPTPAPEPGYQIAGPSGPALPGAEIYPPVCLRYPPACGLRYDPGTGTWNPGG
jgi:hypothetical protein